MQIQKEKLHAVDYVKVVFNKTVGNANTAWTSQNLGGLAGKNAVVLKGGVLSIGPHLEVNLLLQAQLA